MGSEEVDIRVEMASYIKALMSDAQFYGWECTNAFHRVWLKQLEKGRCTWFDEEATLQFCRTLIWHPACSSPASNNVTRNSPRTRQRCSQTSYSAPVKRGTKACQAFNQGNCDNKATHGNLQHICFY